MTRITARSLTLASLALGFPTALAHDWYPIACCSSQDCRALIEENGETVMESTGGWKLWDGRTIERGLAKQSPDRRFHLCETPGKRVICFFAPPGAS